MKHLTKNNVLAWMLAIITAVCAFLGIILTTPQTNTAYADAEQITQETFPDTSTWEEKGTVDLVADDAEWFKNNFANRFFRFRYSVEEHELLSTRISIMTNDQLHVDSIVLDSGSLSLVGNFVVKDYGTYLDFIYYPLEDDMYISYFEFRDDVVFLEPEEVKSSKILVELVEPEVNEDLPENDKTEDESKDDVKWNDKVADWINEQTGWAVTGSLVGIVCIGAVVYFVFIRRKK